MWKYLNEPDNGVWGLPPFLCICLLILAVAIIIGWLPELNADA